MVCDCECVTGAHTAQPDSGFFCYVCMEVVVVVVMQHVRCRRRRTTNLL